MKYTDCPHYHCRMAMVQDEFIEDEHCNFVDKWCLPAYGHYCQELDDVEQEMRRDEGVLTLHDITAEQAALQVRHRGHRASGVPAYTGS